ncbi:hypothetical protein N806_12240 [Rhodococcus sp. P27]|nr:hypothetical protein N806_12240 [Rhodococcus sp. P27]
MEQLECDQAILRGVVRLVHFPHSASAEEATQLVHAESGS